MATATARKPKPRPETGERNTFGLPRGEKLRREVRAVFAEQRGRILGFLRAGRKDAGGNLPFAWPDWNDFGLGALAVSERMTPLLSLTWDAAGSKFLSKIGLDPDSWSVTNPHLARMIDEAALAFSESMNRTTSLALDRALDKTREELHQGVVVEGESVEVLTKRINAIFDGAERWRARRIAQTETSRAVHAAQEQAAIQSGVVVGWEFLLSGDACSKCIAIAARARFVRLGTPFAVIGDNPHYATIKFPPVHPSCNCICVEILDTDEQPAWSDTLRDPEPATEDEHRAVAEITQARDEATIAGSVAWGATHNRTRKPKKPAAAVKPPPAPKPARAAKPKPSARPAPAKPRKPAEPPWEWGRPVEPDLPIDARIRRSPAWGRTKRLARANEAYLAARDAAAAADRAHRDLFDRVTGALKGPLSDAEKAEWSRKVGESLARLKVLRAARDGAKASAEEETARILAVPDRKLRFRWSPDDSGLTTDASRAAAVAADAFLEPILAAGPGSVGTRTRVSFHTIPRGKPQRAECKDWKGELWLKQAETPGVAVHEWGHQIERSVPGVRAATQAFLDHRVGSEAPRKLKDVMKGRYRDDELGREDDFGKAFGDRRWYVGKVYRDASEVISMGLEELYNNPGDFAKKDPEYCAFILGILDGSLRKP